MTNCLMLLGASTMVVGSWAIAACHSAGTCPIAIQQPSQNRGGRCQFFNEAVHGIAQYVGIVQFYISGSDSVPVPGSKMRRNVQTNYGRFIWNGTAFAITLVTRKERISEILPRASYWKNCSMEQTSTCNAWPNVTSWNVRQVHSPFCCAIYIKEVRHVRPVHCPAERVSWFLCALLLSLQSYSPPYVYLFISLCHSAYVRFIQY